MPRAAKKTERPNGTERGLAKTEAQWDIWFQHFIEKGGNLSRACELGSISRDAVYFRREHDPIFEARFQAAKQKGVEVMEDAATKRAVEGVERGVYFQGIRIDQTTEYSDALIQFLLKANKPEKYKDRSAVETTDRTPRPFLGHDLSRLSKERLAQLRDILAEAKPQDEPDLSAAQGTLKLIKAPK